MKSLRNVVLLLAAGALAASALAAEAEIGMDAPPLKISDWVKGKAVDLKDGKGKNIYVVEFWATWCGPCKRSIPHLTDLQKKYADKNVVIIGVSNEARDAEKVREFVKKQGDKMDYLVAVDSLPESAKGEKKKASEDEEGEEPMATLTSAAYMDAFQIEGIPCAFIIDKDGKIVFVGNPLDEDDNFDGALEKVVAGKWTVADGKKVLADARKRDEAQRDPLENAYRKYFSLVRSDSNAAEAKKLAEEFLKGAAKNPQALNAFAWELLTNKKIKNRDMDLAMRMAKAAYDASEGKDAAIVDTYARALFDSGKLDEALKYQRKAVELCGEDADPRMVKELKDTLKKYEGAQKKE